MRTLTGMTAWIAADPDIELGLVHHGSREADACFAAGMRNHERAKERETAENRLEIMEALVLASSQRAEVIEVVGNAENTNTAELAVRDLLGVGEVPARAVLDAQLRRFTSRERANLTASRDELRAYLEGLE